MSLSVGQDFCVRIFDPYIALSSLIGCKIIVFFDRYKKREDRVPLNEAMHLLLPMTYNLMLRLLPDQSEQSVLLQKQVLKVFYSLIQVSLSTKYEYHATFIRSVFNSVVNFSTYCRWKLFQKRYSLNGWKF